MGLTDKDIDDIAYRLAGRTAARQQQESARRAYGRQIVREASERLAKLKRTQECDRLVDEEFERRNDEQRLKNMSES